MNGVRNMERNMLPPALLTVRAINDPALPADAWVSVLKDYKEMDPSGGNRKRPMDK